MFFCSKNKEKSLAEFVPFFVEEKLRKVKWDLPKKDKVMFSLF